MRILFIVHQYPPRHRSGTEQYTHHLAKELGARHDVMVYTHEAALDGSATPATDETYDGVAVHRAAAWPQGVSPRPWELFRWSYANPRIEADFAAALDRFRPDLIHIQHLKDVSAGVIGMAAAQAIPVVMTLHDYWAICPNAQCIRPDGALCWRTHARVECGLCAAERLAQPALRFAAPLMAPLFWARQSYLRRQMRQVRRFVAPSRFLRERYIAAGYAPERIIPVEIGLAPGHVQPIARPQGSFHRRYAFIGSLAWQKGAHTMIEAFRRLGDAGAELRVWGSLQTFPDYAQRLRALAEGCPWIRLEGELDYDRVGEALAWADYLIVPSVWWENSPATIQEAYTMGVPVIASDCGALAEKVQHERSGLLFVAGDAEDLARALRRTLADPTLLDALRAGLPRVKTMAELAGEMEQLYAEVIAKQLGGEARGLGEDA